MKQVILGMVCCLIVIYTIVSALSIYSISSRRNEVENCLSRVAEQNLREYYVRPIVIEVTPEEEDDEDGDERDSESEGEEEEEVTEPIRLYSDSQVAAFVREDILNELRSDSQVTVQVHACDMEAGIISVSVTEKFTLPSGTKKEIRCDKTIIVEDTEEVKTRFISSKYLGCAEDEGGLSRTSRWLIDGELYGQLCLALSEGS